MLKLRDSHPPTSIVAAQAAQSLSFASDFVEQVRQLEGTGDALNRRLKWFGITCIRPHVPSHKHQKARRCGAGEPSRSTRRGDCVLEAYQAYVHAELCFGPKWVEAEELRMQPRGSARIFLIGFANLSGKR